MKLWKKFASFSIYPKLVLTFLIVLSPMYVISWRMNDAGSATVEKEITESLESRTSLYMNMLEFDLSRVISLQQEYATDDDLLRLTSPEDMTEIEKMQAQIGLKSRLDILKRSSKFIENASAFIPAMDRTISANDKIFTALDQDQLQALYKSTNRFESPFIVWHDRIFISVPYPDPAIAGHSKPMFVLAVEISKPELASVLDEFTSEGGGAVLSGDVIPWAVGGTGTAADEAMLLEASSRQTERGMADSGGAAAPAAPDDGKRANAAAEEAKRLSPGAAPEPEIELPDMPSDNPSSIRNVSLKGESYMVVSQSSPRLGMTLHMYVPTRRVTASLDSYRSWFNAFSVAMLFVVLLFAYLIYLIIHQPLKKLVRSFRRVEQGKFDSEVRYPLKDEFSYLYGQFNGMVKRLDVLVHEVYEQQYRARLAELRHLQSQINPHFLYNSYFILYRMAMLQDHDNVVYFTKHLGEYFQYITRDGMEDVPLESEIKHARTYAEIQSVRFSGRIRVEFGELPDAAASLPVPRLILQPLIENCYNHGLENKRNDGLIRVEFGGGEDNLVLVVEDNGGAMNEDKLRELRLLLHEHERADERTGLSNVHRRIQIKYGGQGGLSLELGEERGLRVVMTIPTEGSAADDQTAYRG